MNKIECQQLLTELCSLAVINLEQDPIITPLKDLLIAICKDLPSYERAKYYSIFAKALHLSEQDNLTDYVITATQEADSLYYRSFYPGSKTKPESLISALSKECQTLAKLASLDFASLTDAAGIQPALSYRTKQISSTKLTKMIKGYATNQLKSKGCGIFAKSHAFYLNGTQLTPVSTPDPITLSELSGYEDERKQVIDNTLALIEGKPASNILLYGDSGTGKSSTVKAIANDYHDKGLKLIEITKNQLVLIPQILDIISGLPQKFILFIDDLSFNENDSDYAALKAILEGSIYSSYHNSVLYATSNRLHLIKEYFSDRKGDEIHFNDTMSELMSLSERFGLRVTFLSPDRKQYLDIVTSLYNHYQINRPLPIVLQEAEQYANYRGSRSPRTAKQFIRGLKSSEN